MNLHWLRVLERIQYKLCVLVHRCLDGAALQYLSELIQPLSDVDSSRRLRSASTAEVLVPATRGLAIGDRAFAVAGSRGWNNLPVDLRLSRTFTTFKHNTPRSHICSTYPFLQFDCIIDCIIDYFCTEPLKPLMCIRLFKFVIITLHYSVVTHQAPVTRQQVVMLTNLFI